VTRNIDFSYLWFLPVAWKLDVSDEVMEFAEGSSHRSKKKLRVLAYFVLITIGIVFMCSVL